MTLLETVLSIETKGLVRRRLGTDPDRNVELLEKARRVFINEGEVECFVEPEHAVQDEPNSSLDDVAPEDDEALGYEISDKDWSVMHSVEAGDIRNVDPLDIDWLKQAGLVEGTADSVVLNKMAKDWIHGNTNTHNDDLTGNEEGWET